MLYSARRLINEHREARLYVTQISYSRDGEPSSFYIFMPEGNTESMVNVYSVVARKKLRTRKETLYYVRTSNDHSLLLIIDHLRGNHYSYCKLNTLNYILETVHRENEALTNQEQLAASIDVGHVAEKTSDIQDKVVIVDSEILCKHMSVIDELVKNNKIVLSPYYAMEIESFTSSLGEKNNVITQIDNYIQQYPNRIFKNTYLLRLKIDLTNPNEYLLTIAAQQQVSKSDIYIVTMRTSFTSVAKLQGFSIFLLEAPIEFSEIALTSEENNLLENKQIELIQIEHSRTTEFVAFDLGGLPPRSKRHPRPRSLTLRAFRTFLTFISF